MRNNMIDDPPSECPAFLCVVVLLITAGWLSPDIGFAGSLLLTVGSLIMLGHVMFANRVDGWSMAVAGVMATAVLLAPVIASSAESPVKVVDGPPGSGEELLIGERVSTEVLNTWDLAPGKCRTAPLDVGYEPACFTMAGVLIAVHYVLDPPGDWWEVVWISGELRP